MGTSDAHREPCRRASAPPAGEAGANRRAQTVRRISSLKTRFRQDENDGSLRPIAGPATRLFLPIPAAFSAIIVHVMDLPRHGSPLLVAACLLISASGASGCWMMAGIGEAGDSGDSESDSETETHDENAYDPIPMDCSECPSLGGEILNMLCAIDLCDLEYVLAMEYGSPQVVENQLEQTYEAVLRLGWTTNKLAPRLHGSYALMATGPAEGTWHSQDLGGIAPGHDPFSDDPDENVYDTVEWRLDLRAPDLAQAFRFKYVFLSEEYDDYIGTEFNDKFYVILEADSTNAGQPTVINFTRCRDPQSYVDFVCAPGDQGCTPGTSYCYIAINSAFSDCCWNEGCPDATPVTNLGGTGFECAGQAEDDGDTHGSSTGWLLTSWPIEGGETFRLTFHLHDTGDAVFDSEVILDAFQFLMKEDQGTQPTDASPETDG
jgi:hypothetical protein